MRNHVPKRVAVLMGQNNLAALTTDALEMNNQRLRVNL